MIRRASTVVTLLALCLISTALPAQQISTTAKVEITDMNDKVIALKPPEKIAVMFLQAITSLEDDCRHHLNRPCPMDELVKGPKAADWKMSKLKYDPATDPDYTYTITISGNGWQLHADPRRPRLGGFFYDGRSLMIKFYYNPGGPATEKSTQFGGISIDGDSFKVR